VALVTSRGCAGFIDFISEIKLSPYAFIVDFYHASVQGQKVEEEIVATLKTIGNRFEQYDVLVIVRGGGAITDLKWFDNKNVGIAIANSPLPVLTGIGHEINLTVADMIANMNFKTPTAVASYLVNKVGEYERSLNALIKNIHESAGSLLDKSKREMVDLIGSIHHQTEQIVLDKKAELFGLIKDIVSETKPMLSSANASFSALNANIFKALPIYLKNKKAALANLDEKLRTYDPRKAIKLGYSITRNSRGVIIKRLGQVSSNDEIITNLIDGNILSVVAGKEGANGK
jgi:exodeoxyribonuclease VII large subunit